MLARKFNYALENFKGVEHAGRVVGVDYHNPLGFRGDFFAHVVKVGIPFVRLVADIVNRGPAGKRHRGGPKRVIGHGYEDFVTAVE